MSENAETPKQYTVEQLKTIGLVDPHPGLRPKPMGSIRFEIRGDEVVSVETPINAELNIIVKPWAKVNSLLGEALLSTGIAKNEE